MSGAVAASALAGALGGLGVAGFVPELRGGFLRGREHLRQLVRRGGRGLDRAVPFAIGGGLLLLVLGASTAGAIVGIAPAVLRSVRRAHRSRRRRAVAAGAPIVARSLADALDAGHGVGPAIGEASRATGLHGPAVEELRTVAARLAAGDPLSTSLDAWRERADEPAHTAIAATLLLHGDSGGELAAVLRDQVDALERARRSAAEAESAIVQARTAARIVGGVPAAIALGTVVLAPGTIGAITASWLGSLLVVAAILLQVGAMVAVRRLTTGLVA